MKCPFCDCDIPKERVDLGFGTCIKCSTEKKYGYIHVFEGKTADTIAVIRDPDVAKKINKEQNRRKGRCN